MKWDIASVSIIRTMGQLMNGEVQTHIVPNS